MCTFATNKKDMPEKFEVDLDTAYLRFDPNDTKFYSKICKEIPAFAAYESGFAQAESTRLRIFAWIVIMYDMNTPLRREIKDLYKRKVYAGNLCGINTNAVSGKYKTYIEDILVGQDKAVNGLIVKYISSFASSDYKQLIAHMKIQDDMLTKIVSGKADKNVQEMFDRATDKIKELTNLIYGTGERDEVYEARKALYKQVAYDLSDMRPEKVAKVIAEGIGLPKEWGPYGDYLPDDINFVGDDPDIARDDEERLP